MEKESKPVLVIVKGLIMTWPTTSSTTHAPYTATTSIITKIHNRRRNKCLESKTYYTTPNSSRRQRSRCRLSDCGRTEWYHHRRYIKYVLKDALKVVSEGGATWSKGSGLLLEWFQMYSTHLGYVLHAYNVFTITIVHTWPCITNCIRCHSNDITYTVVYLAWACAKSCWPVHQQHISIVKPSCQKMLDWFTYVKRCIYDNIIMLFLCYPWVMT